VAQACLRGQLRCLLGELVEQFRARALGTGVALGIIALGGIFVLRADAPRLFQGLTGRALPLVLASALFGLVSPGLLLRRRFVAVRVTAALAVVTIIWGWALDSTRTCWSRA
jgi:cytochrome d ubiquinol oxidase subunit II